MYSSALICLGGSPSRKKKSNFTLRAYPAIQPHQLQTHSPKVTKPKTRNGFSNYTSGLDGDHTGLECFRRGYAVSPKLAASKLTCDTEKAQAHFELGITLALFFWPELSLAVTNQWGGPESTGKREWFAQATVDLLKETPDADAEWIETFLLQVMLDEFEVNVDDDSAYEIGEQIVRLRKDCGRGNFAEVQSMRTKWEARGGREVISGFQNNGDVEAEETDGEGESGDEEGDVDMDMDEAPPLLRARERAVPEVDEDGFTTVPNRRKR